MFVKKTIKNDKKITFSEIWEKIDLDFLKSNNQHNQTTRITKQANKQQTSNRKCHQQW
jgi:hypothetical protein